MTNHESDNGLLRGREEVERPSRRTELVRAAADGELTAADEKALQAHLAAHPDDRAVIEFEHRVRRAIAASVSGAPSQALRARISRLTNESVSQSAPLRFQPDPMSAAPRMIRTVRWLAVAASVGLVAGLVYLTIQPSGTLPPPGQLVAESHRVSLVSFVSRQHDECELHADMVGSKLRISELDKVPAAFSEVLGKEPDLGRLDDCGLKFMGAGPCAVPGRGRSVHLIFDAGSAQADRGGRTPMVSIFVQQDSGELNIEPGRTYRLVPTGSAPSLEASEIYVWKSDGFVYFLASTSGPAMDKARMALGAKEPSGSL